LSGNHNDLYNAVGQFARMIKELSECEIIVENSILNADKGFDVNKLRRVCRRRKITPNIKENVRNKRKRSSDESDILTKSIQKTICK
jgi:hypothetical protein